jgi:hypothetical protein
MEPEGAGPQLEDDCAATGDRTVASAAAMTDAKVLTTILGRLGTGKRDRGW